ncbi:MAG TPA: hypothetical protein DCY13_23235, partial [Verrucomicrobiales bacterium]|nr:hypothetical protein [Verrucomicrobiales bacterium]
MTGKPHVGRDFLNGIRFRHVLLASAELRTTLQISAGIYGIICQQSSMPIWVFSCPQDVHRNSSMILREHGNSLSITNPSVQTLRRPVVRMSLGYLHQTMSLANCPRFRHSDFMQRKSKKPGSTSGQGCLARNLLQLMFDEPGLEAVSVPIVGSKLAVATMGRDVPADLADRVGEAVDRGSSSGRSIGCGLVEGTNDCQSCPKPLEGAALASMKVDRDNSRITFSRVTCPTAPKFWRWNKIRLPRLVPREVELPAQDEHELHHLEHEWKWQLAAAVACGVAGLVGALIGEGTAAIALYMVAYVAGSWFAAVETFERLRKSVIDVHFLMLAVAVGSASIGAWGEGATLLFLFSLSGALEHYALGRTQREIHSLFKEAPKTATVVADDGTESEMPVNELRPAMRLAIKPDSQFPVDAKVIKGSTAADESNLSGEAAPVNKAPGDDVLAGTMNLWGRVEIEVSRPAAESALQKIIKLIREAQRSKAPSQRLTDRFGSGYTVGVLLLTLTMFIVWWQVSGLAPFLSTESARSAFYRAMTLLVVASPCALVLSIPSAILAAIASAARKGILFRGGSAVEMLAEVNVVALDKTGTITTGDLSVESLQAFPEEGREKLEKIAASLARHSTHPLSRALTAHAKSHGWPAVELDHFESISGQGISARINGEPCLLGRRELIGSLGAAAAQAALARMPAPGDPRFGQPEVWIAGADVVGVIRLRDDLRPEAAALLQRLRQRQLRTVLLTGDRRSNAETIRRQLLLDDVQSELRPHDKLAYILKQNEAGARVAMIGDGVNDAPSLAAAHVGVAMGARGSDAALEQADVVLMHDRLENFLTAIELSRRARRIIRQNLFLSLGTVVVLVAFAL